MIKYFTYCYLTFSETPLYVLC